VAIAKILDEGIRVVVAVRDDDRFACVFEQMRCHSDFVRLALRDAKGDGSAVGIHDRMNLGTQTTTRCTDRLGAPL
jgi:hypothetical protein